MMPILCYKKAVLNHEHGTLQVTGTLENTNFLEGFKGAEGVLYARPLVEAGTACVSVADGLPTWCGHPTFVLVATLTAPPCLCIKHHLNFMALQSCTRQPRAMSCHVPAVCFILFIGPMFGYCFILFIIPMFGSVQDRRAHGEASTSVKGGAMGEGDRGKDPARHPHHPEGITQGSLTDLGHQVVLWQCCGLQYLCVK